MNKLMFIALFFAFDVVDKYTAARMLPELLQKNAQKISSVVRRFEGEACEHEGEEVEGYDPCDWCVCYNGEVTCHKIMCDWIPPYCIDQEPVEDVCCVTFECPNGPNSWHSGTIIPGNEILEEVNDDTGCFTMWECPDPYQHYYTPDTQAEKIAEFCPSQIQIE